MAKNKDREEVSLEEMTYAGLVQAEAIPRLLIQKVIVTEEELLAEERVVHEMQGVREGKDLGL